MHREIDGTETARRIGLYKRGCFVLEAKQESGAWLEDAHVRRNLERPASLVIRNVLRIVVEENQNLILH